VKVNLLKSRTGRWFSFIALLALILGTFATSFAQLAGSSFESSDGNLVVNNSANKDWANAGINCTSTPRVGCDLDKPTGQTDDSFGQGSKEDIPTPSVVNGSIPNNKSDLTRFYTANEKASGKSFLYLGWERANTLGTANMDFEFNQSKTLSGNGVTPVRTAGDMLITFDFAQGGNTVNLGLLRWVTSGAASQCFSSSSVPCWGNRMDLSAAHVADGAVNDPGFGQTSVQDPISGQTLPQDTFGEAAINLTDAGVFPANQCVNFGSAYLKSRSSTSFTAELKDFIAPLAVSVTNCGTINIHKQDDAGNALAGATFTLYTDNAPVGGTRGAEDTATTLSCTTTVSTVSNGDCTIANVPFGNYWVVETTTPTGYSTAADQSVSLTSANTPISLTFVDNRQSATVNILKKDDAGNVLAGATFTLYTDNAPVGGSRGTEDTATTFSCTTGTDGKCSITNILTFGDYWVVETTTPAGYNTASDQHVTLGLNGSASLTFTDPRLHRVIVLVCHEGTNTLTSSTNNVSLDGAQATSLSSVPAALAAKGVTEQDLCSLGGAQFNDKDHGTYNGSVTINP
jgi:hypothetical protein